MIFTLTELIFGLALIAAVTAIAWHSLREGDHS